MPSPRLLLIFPPQAPPLHPPLALPVLLSAARAAGLEAHQVDLNLVFYREVLDQGYLDTVSTAVRRMAEEPPASGPEGTALRIQAGLGPSTAAAVPGAVSTLTGPDFYDPARYAAAIHDLSAALRLVGTRYAAPDIGLLASVLRYSERSSAEIVSALDDRDANPYLDLLERPLTDLLDRLRPGYAGLSVTYTSQIIPAFTLARLTRLMNPGLKIILGGNTISQLGTRLTLSRLGSLADVFIVGEGEEVLPVVIDRIERGLGLTGLPGVLLPGATAGGTTPRGEGPVLAPYPADTPPAPPVDLEAAPLPDYDGLDPGAYLSPEPVLPLQFSRGCYWGKCAFCSYNIVYGSSYRSFTPRRVIDYLRQAHERYGVRAFHTADSAVSPRLLGVMSEAIEASGLDVRWDVTTRLEPGLDDPVLLDTAYRAGCRLIRFGLESASPRVLSLMRKGTDPSSAEKIIASAGEAGLWVMLLFFLGFPGETAAEAEMTVDFIRRHRRRVQLATPAIEFTLVSNSPVMADPGGFGISRVDLVPGHDLALVYGHEVRAGPPRSEVTRMAATFGRWLREQGPAADSSLLWPMLDGHDLLYAARYRPERIAEIKTGFGGRTHLDPSRSA